jgi:hypothetical protein
MSIFADLIPSGGQAPAAPAPQAAPPVPQPATGTGSGATTNTLAPVNNFAKSAGMQFQLKQGEDAIQNNYAAHGALQSGSAMKALQSYGQQTALNNYFMPYMQMLQGQQNMGASTAASLAGQGATYAGNMANLGSSYGAATGAANSNYGSTVTGLDSSLAGSVGALGQNYANATTGINGQMGQAINSGAQNIGNLQLANGQNQAAMYGQIGGALGQFAGQVFPAGGHY